MGIETLPPDGRHGSADRRSPTTWPSSCNIAPDAAAAVRGRSRRSPTRPGCTPARIAAPARRLRARRPRRWSATAPGSWCRDLAGRSTHRAEGRRDRPRARRPAPADGRRHAEAPGARGLPLRGGRRLARAADARRRRLGAADFFELESFRVAVATHRAPATGRGTTAADARDRGHRQAAGRRRAPHRGRRGQRPGQRPRRRRSGTRQRPATRRSTDIHLVDYKVRVLDTGGGHRGGHPGADRHHRR